eukprot:5672183-Prymnesium_polylepis.1
MGGQYTCCSGTTCAVNRRLSCQRARPLAASVRVRELVIEGPQPANAQQCVRHGNRCSILRAPPGCADCAPRQGCDFFLGAPGLGVRHHLTHLNGD